MDDLLKWQHEHGRVEDSVGWQLAVVHLRVTLHLTLVLQLLKPLGCNYGPVSSADLLLATPAEAEAGSGDGGWHAANGTELDAAGLTLGVMQGATGVFCWDEAGPQPTMALAALLALAFYLLTVHVVGGDRVLTRARQGTGLDVRYSELYTVVANTLGIVAAAALGLLKASALGPARDATRAAPHCDALSAPHCDAALCNARYARTPLHTVHCAL